MKKLNKFLKKLWKDESGQGTAEWILLTAIVVGAVVAFGPRIKKAIEGQVGNIEGKMSQDLTQ